MKDRAKTSTAPDHLVIFVNSYRIICKTCICILICTTLLVEKYNLDTGTLGAEVFGVFFYIIGSMQLILYVSFTSAVYEVGHNTCISSGSPQPNPVLLLFWSLSPYSDNNVVFTNTGYGGKCIFQSIYWK